jgi:hypothetical protein
MKLYYLKLFIFRCPVNNPGPRRHEPEERQVSPGTKVN